MHPVDLLTTIAVGLLIGVELSVSAFANPTLWSTSDMATTSNFAARLGKPMPFWYALDLALLVVQTYTHRHTPGFLLIITAAAGWLAIILFTVMAMVH